MTALVLALLLTGCKKEEAIDPPAAPVVIGEVSAGHPTPTWLWDAVDGASEYQARIDEGTWFDVDPGVLQYTANTDLAEGAHTFEVQAGNGEWSESGSFVTTVEYFHQDGYWDGVARSFATSPFGAVTGVVCHNCYVADVGSTYADNLADTLTAVHNGQAADADLIELDIKVEGGVWTVGHDDVGLPDNAALADVLADAALLAGDQPLYLEIKETEPNRADTDALLGIVFDAGYAVNGRPVVFRAFGDNRERSLGFVIDALPNHPLHAPYVRTHLLLDTFSAFDLAGFYDLADEAVTSGYDGVEINKATADVLAFVTYARDLGLGTTIWTLPDDTGPIFCAALGAEVDALVTDALAGDCRAAIEDVSDVLYLNPWADAASGGTVDLWSAGAASTVAVGASGQPVLVDMGVDGAPHGTVLEFAGAQTLDLDGAGGDGILLSAVIQPDSMSLAASETQTLFATDSHRLAISSDVSAVNTLVFSVKIGGNWEQASALGSRISTTGANFVVATYEPGGAVEMWIGTSAAGVTPSGVLTGAIDPATQDWTVGSLYTGAVQQVRISDWPPASSR